MNLRSQVTLKQRNIPCTGTSFACLKAIVNITLPLSHVSCHGSWAQVMYLSRVKLGLWFGIPLPGIEFQQIVTSDWDLQERRCWHFHMASCYCQILLYGWSEMWPQVVSKECDMVSNKISGWSVMVNWPQATFTGEASNQITSLVLRQGRPVVHIP